MTKTWSKRAQKAHRKLLIAALRSGEYRQTKNQLTDGKGFCCLGVACEISKLGHWEGEHEWNYVTATDSSNVALPLEVQRWLGFQSHTGQYNDYVGSLADDNDEGKRFKAIADIIESEPEGLVIK